MKFEIQKKKLDDVMYKYIDDLLENNELGELNYTYFNEIGDERDWQITFYFGDYGYKNTAFVWQTNEIYEHYGLSECEECPKVIVEKNIEDTLNGMFNDMWKPIFKKWVKEKYNLDPKSIV